MMIKRNLGKVAIGTLAVVVTIGLVLGLLAPVIRAAENPNASAKATCKLANINLIDGTTQQGWTTLLTNTIKTPNQKDLFIDVSLQCGLYTQTLVKSKGGNKDTSKAEAVIQVRVLVDGEEADPGKVVFARRQQELSATLEGMIGDCLWVDPNDPNRVIVDENCVTPEEIELILKTMNANSFNFVQDDLSSGVHTVEVQARIRTRTDADDGSANAKAMVGKGSVTIEEVRMIKEEEILLQ